MVLKTIFPGWIILGKNMNNDNLGTLKEIFCKHMSKDGDTVEVLKDTEDYEELLYLLGFSFVRGPLGLPQGMRQYQVDLNTCYAQEMDAILKELFNSGYIKEYRFLCWENNLSDDFYIIEARQEMRKHHFEVASFIVADKESFIYHVNDKYIESNNRDEYKGKEITEKEIITELDSPWCGTSTMYTISVNYPYQFHVCEYNVPVYDGIEVSLYGYGASPEEALKNVKDRQEHLRNQAMIKQNYLYQRDHC